MMYAIIETKCGEKQGINPRLHRLTANGEKMVVNENELRKINPDISVAVQMLGGILMSDGETLNELKKNRFIRT